MQNNIKLKLSASPKKHKLAVKKVKGSALTGI